MTRPTSLPELFAHLRAEVREARIAALLAEASEWARRQPQAATQAPYGPPPCYPTAWPTTVSLSEILRWRDADFVRACYEALLRRPADPEGFHLYLGEVRAGRSRTEIAIGFALSEEGRSAGVTVQGLEAARWRLRLQRLPVVGYLVRLVRALALAPRLLREREATEAFLLAQVANVEARAATEARLARLEAAYVHERQARNLGGRLARLSDQAQAALDRLPAVEDALHRVRVAGVDELARAAEAAKADLHYTTAVLRTEIAEARGAVEPAVARAERAAQALQEHLRDRERDRPAQEARLAALESRFAAVEAHAAAARDAAVAAAAQGIATLRAEMAAGHGREDLARLEAAHREVVARLDRDDAHTAAQDAQMQSIREAGMAELAQATGALEARLLEVLTREGELLERRVGERLGATADIERAVEALRAALATFGKDRRP